MTQSSTKGRSIQGVVVSSNMTNTIVLMVEETYKHQYYGKVLKRSKKVSAHDEENRAKVGDVVIIKECKPVSKSKKFALTEIVEKVS